MEYQFIYDNGNKEVIEIPSETSISMSEAFQCFASEPPVKYDESNQIIYIFVEDPNLKTWIRGVRKERHWNQTHLAEVADISLAYVSQFERGFLVPSNKTIANIVAALLFGETSEPNEMQSNETSRDIASSIESFDKKIIREMIDSILLQNDEATIELLKTTLVSIAKVQNEINKDNSFQSSIDFLINIAAIDFQNGLKKLKK